MNQNGHQLTFRWLAGVLVSVLILATAAWARSLDQRVTAVEKLVAERGERLARIEAITAASAERLIRVESLLASLARQ